MRIEPARVAAVAGMPCVAPAIVVVAYLEYDRPAGPSRMMNGGRLAQLTALRI